METLNGWTYDTQELVEPFAIINRHVTRLKFYEREMEIMQDLKAYVVFANDGHLVQKFLECRINPDTHQWEVLVQWISLDVADNSWEPASILQEDVPKLFRRWVASEPKAEALRTFIHTESTRRRDK